MIESEFCARCERPYAMRRIALCDSCLKDMEYEFAKTIVKADKLVKRLRIARKIKHADLNKPMAI